MPRDFKYGWLFSVGVLSVQVVAAVTRFSSAQVQKRLVEERR